MTGVRRTMSALVRERRLYLLAATTLAIPIALVAVVLAVAHAAILHPLPYPSAEQLGRLQVEVKGERGVRAIAPSLSDIERWRPSGIVSSFTASSDLPFGCVLKGDVPQRVSARRTTEDGTFRQIPPSRGRDFNAQDMDPSAPNVAILGHRFWRLHFGSSEVLGKTIRCDNQFATIIGVLPKGVDPEIDLFFPLRLTGPTSVRRGTLDVRVRVSDGTLRQAEEALSATLSREDLGSDQIARVRIRPLAEATAKANAAAVRALAAGAAIALVIGVVNVGGLLMARNAGRRRNLAVCLAMGATRRRLAWQLVLEGLALAVIAGMLGVWAAWLGLDLLVPLLPVTLPPFAVSLGNWTVILGLLALIGIVGVAFGLLMASQAAIGDLGRELNRPSRLGPALSRRGAQWLIGGQVALAVTLAALGGVLVRSYTKLIAVDLGFSPAGVIAFEVSPVDITDSKDILAFYHELLRRVSTLTAVESVGLVDHFILSDTSVSSQVSMAGQSAGVAVTQTLGDYFSAIGVRPVHGALLPAMGTATQSVAVLNSSAAQRLLDSDPIGSQLHVGKRTYTVTAIIPDLIHGGPLQETKAEVFLTYDPADPRSRLLQSLTLVVRTRDNSNRLLASLEREIRSIGPPVLIGPIRPGREWLAERVAVPRRQIGFFGTLAVVGAILMLVGVFSATRYLIAKRTKEIGLRVALGAAPSDVVRESLGVSGVGVGLGLVVGLFSATLVTPTVKGFLFHTVPNDPLVFACVSAAIGMTAMLAGWVPARGASLIHPVESLREEI
jgi:putative ABC transport system permease protein